jgi:hypothetical protein
MYLIPKPSRHQTQDNSVTRAISRSFVSQQKNELTRAEKQAIFRGMAQRFSGSHKTSRSQVTTITHFPAQPFTLIVPSDFICENQIFVCHLVSAKKYTQVEHLLRDHFVYKKTDDIEQLKGKNYPFWYYIDNRGELFYVDGHKLSPYNFIVKQHHTLSIVMIADTINMGTCDKENCVFSRTPQGRDVTHHE